MKTLLRILVLMCVLSLTAQNTYLHCGKLIDTKSGKVLKEKTIVVSGNKIVSVENGYVNPKNAEDIIVDLKSKTVIKLLAYKAVHT